jgi:arginyl-tRNA synthetase
MTPSSPPENVFAQILDCVRAVIDALVADGALPTHVEGSRVHVEPPRDAAHGDMATNVALVLAKEAGIAPRALAETIAGKLRGDPRIAQVAIAGPGFINLTLSRDIWIAALQSALRLGPAYGRSALGADEPVNVEYVSANPTGPMHVGKVEAPSLATRLPISWPLRAIV